MKTHIFLAAVTALSLSNAAADAKPKTHPAHPAAPAVLSPAPPEAEGFDSTRLARLTAAMHAQVDSGALAGIQTMLVRHGRVVNFDSYGKASWTSGAAVAPDTIYRMYSQTKPMMGVAMMILFEQGKWRLEDPVSKFIPEFANLKVFAGLDWRGNPILEDMKHPPTMRELMTHTAGFGYGLRSDNYVDQQFAKLKVLQSSSLQDMVDKIATIPLRYQPGTRWSYSAGVDIQGYIIEKLTGMRLSDFLKANLFGPLGMKDTGFYVPADKASRLAGAFAINPANGQLVEITPAMVPALQDFTLAPAMDSGGGGTVSTAGDYARFCQMILNGGALDGTRILSPAGVALIESDQIESTVVPDEPKKGRAPIGAGALGFGFDMAVAKDSAKLGSLAGTGSIFWGGAAGTWFWIDPKNDLFFLGMIQRFPIAGTDDDSLETLSQTMVYQALVDPAR
jgi:CubicO group peptidase (beta-lactamase class C family)